MSPEDTTKRDRVLERPFFLFLQIIQNPVCILYVGRVNIMKSRSS